VRMATNQEGKHAAFRVISGTSGTYNEDALAAFQADGATSTNFNGAFVEWLQLQTTSTETNINDLQQLFAVQLGFTSWRDVDTFADIDFRLLEDACFRLLEDGTSKRLLE